MSCALVVVIAGGANKTACFAWNFVASGLASIRGKSRLRVCVESQGTLPVVVRLCWLPEINIDGKHYAAGVYRTRLVSGRVCGAQVSVFVTVVTTYIIYY